jgi:hypothetical protein
MAAVVQTDLMVSFSQILEGQAKCEDCDGEAQVVLSCEPDYDNAPMCWKCARPFVWIALHCADKFWGKPKEQSE